MNVNIIKYLRKHKGRYSKEKLANALLRAGYDREEIIRGVREVYGRETRPKPSGLHSGVSCMDLVFGFIGNVLLYAVAYWVADELFWRLEELLIVIFFLLNVAVLVPIFRFRRGLALGMATAMIISGEVFVALGALFEILEDIIF